MAGVNGWQGHSDVQGLRAQLRTIAFIGAPNRLACGRHVNDVAETIPDVHAKFHAALACDPVAARRNDCQLKKAVLQRARLTLLKQIFFMARSLTSVDITANGGT
jgi:hypothetical protein